MNGPAILHYNLDNQQKLKLSFICNQLKLLSRSVPRADYNQPLGALAGLHPRIPEGYAGEGFGDAMLVMVNFTNPLLHSFLNALKQNKLQGIALKAVLTPTNASWDSVKLHDEVLREHQAMRAGKSPQHDS